MLEKSEERKEEENTSEEIIECESGVEVYFQSLQGLKEQQRDTIWMFPIIVYLESGAMPFNHSKMRFIKRNIHLYKLTKEGILLKMIKYSRKLRSIQIEKFVVVIPYTLCEEVLFHCHKDVLSAHLGRTKTWERVRERAYWPGMYQDVIRYVSACEECGSKKGSRPFVVGKRQAMPVDLMVKPFSFIVVDAIGPLPQSKKGNKYILTIVDYLTRFVEAFPVKDLKTSTWLSTLLEGIVTRYGVPLNLLSDQGSNFVSTLAEDFYKTLGIRKKTSTAYHPETQGLVERFNGTLIRIIKMFVSDHQKDWDVYLPKVLFAYRTSYHETIGDSPFYLLYGFDPTIPLDLAFLEGKIKVTDFNLRGHRRKMVREFRDTRNRVAEVMMKAQTKVDRLQFKRIKVEYEMGEPVWLFCYFRKQANSDDDRVSKLAPKWHGPFRVVDKISDNVYKLNVPSHPKKEISVNVNRLKKFRGFWSKPFECEEIDHELLQGDDNQINVSDFPESSFIKEVSYPDEEKVLSNVPTVFKKILAKRIEKVNGKSEVQYLVLTHDYDCVWRGRASLANYRRIIDEFDNQNSQAKSIRRSPRLKEIDLEAGQSHVYFD